MTHLLQIIIIAFSAFALSRLLIRRKDRAVRLGETLFWSVIWIGAILIAIFPGVVNAMAQNAGIGSTIDLIMIVTVLTLFYLQFRLYVKVEQQAQDITRLVREIALRERKGKKK